MTKRARIVSDDKIFETDSSDEEAQRSEHLERGNAALFIRKHQHPLLAGRPIQEKESHDAHESEPSCSAQDLLSDDKLKNQEDDENMSLLETRLRSLLSTSGDQIFECGTNDHIFSYLLRTYFNISSGTLRSGQEEAILRILRNQSVLAISHWVAGHHNKGRHLPQNCLVVTDKSICSDNP